MIILKEFNLPPKKYFKCTYFLLIIKKRIEEEGQKVTDEWRELERKRLNGLEQRKRARDLSNRGRRGWLPRSLRG